MVPNVFHERYETRNIIGAYCRCSQSTTLRTRRTLGRCDDDRRYAHRYHLVELRRNLKFLVLCEHDGQPRPADHLESGVSRQHAVKLHRGFELEFAELCVQGAQVGSIEPSRETGLLRRHISSSGVAVQQQLPARPLPPRVARPVLPFLTVKQAPSRNSYRE